ncbi:hypothetical protein ASD14_02145 [Lysobacter sp. Root494]|nr:hypothetical protein ASD14_02145 [Lysobacter sp. Root494]
MQVPDVIVTARRREEAARDVPLSVTALDADELESRGAQDLGDLGGTTPNLTLYPARAFTGTLTAYIRGVGQADPVWGVEPGVAVYVDDVYLARPQGALLEILDVERVEVLRGPQGTLYGKNTIGGAIKFVSRRPGDAFAGRVALTAGTYSRRDAKAVLNMPLGERFRTRMAIGSFSRDGFGRNLVTGEDVSVRDVGVARFTAQWLPSDYLDVTLSWDRIRDRSGVRGAKRLAVNPFDPQRTPPDPGNFDVRSDAPDIDEVDAQGGSATVDWELNEHWRFKSITAYRKGDSIGYTDFDMLPVTINTLTRVFHDSQATQEFQLHWSGRNDHAVVGLYWFDGEAGGAGYNNSFNQAFGKTEGAIDTRSAAAYGDVTHAFDDRWSIEAGLRYTRERKGVDVFNRSYTDRTYTTPTGQVSADFGDATTFNALSPRLNVSWRPNDEMLLYVQGSRGFKSGSYNIRAVPAVVPESALPLRDESVTSYEAGAKTQWFDGRLTLEAAVFRNDYRDIQLSVFTTYDSNGDGVDDALFGDFRNAGEGTIRGGEIEFAARTGRWLRWTGNAGYLDARYDRYIDRGVDVADRKRFANAPRWTGGASVIADVPFASGASLTARVDGRYQSKVYPTTDLNETIAQAGYSLWNASLAWHSPGRRWDVALVGQNLGDKAYRTTGFSFPTLGVLTGYYGPPRTVAVTVGRDF